MLDSSREVQLRRQRSASRENAQTLRHGTRLSRPVSVPYGNSDINLQTIGRVTSSGYGTSSTSGSGTTPRRSHSDCYTRSSPKPVRKFKIPNSKKM